LLAILIHLSSSVAETVKYFTAEKFEVDRFSRAVSSFQQFAVSTQASGSFLNAMQALILNSATLGALLLAGWEVQHGRMEIGGFVAVQAYVTSMFAPLNFLGVVYQGIIQGMIDVKNLCELLSQEPDVVDAPYAKSIPVLRVWTHNRKARLEGRPLLQMRRCSAVGCGEYLRPEWRFCAYCGSSGSDATAIDDEDDEDGVANGASSPTRRTNRVKSALFNVRSGKLENSRHGLLDDDESGGSSSSSSSSNAGGSSGVELVGSRAYKGVRDGDGDASVTSTDPDTDATPAMVGEGVDVEFSGVYFHYAEQPAEKGLKDVSFHVPAGTSLAVVGHTGAGKTTISRLLFRFYDPLQGEVRLGGYDVKRYTQRSVRRCIGIVPQDTVLFNDTILHNLKYGRMDATMEEVEAAADAAQIRTFIESLPEKWETVVGERGLKLSGGEKQRVAIARCLLKDPPVVLLDEATSALDTATEQSVQNALEALGRKRTVLVIAHRLSTVMNCDQIIVMDGGRVAEKGAHHELLALRGIYHTLWAMQLRSRDDNEAGGRSGSVSRAGSKDNFLESAVSEAAASASASDAVFRAPKQAQGTPPLDIFTMAGTTTAASAAPPAVPAPASAHASS